MSSVEAVERAFGRVAPVHGTPHAEYVAVSLRDRVETRIPVRADGAVEWHDRSGLRVAVARVDTAAAPARETKAHWVYAGALSGGDLVVRATERGIEDFVHFATRPARTSLEYRVKLRGLAARLVAGSFEAVNAEGTPFLRVAPPSVVGRDGEKRPATLEVDGCRVDRNPAPPWGRAFTVGDEECQLRVRWDASVPAPLVVDPEWLLGSEMLRYRSGHAATRLDDGRVLVTGGKDGPTFTSSAELYDPATRTWASTGSMVAPHGGRAYAVGGKVMVIGDGEPEVYSPSSGTFAKAAMITPRTSYGSTALTDGRVLVAGGATGSTPLSTAEVWSPATGTWTAAGSFAVAREAPLLAPLPSGRAIAFGGYVDLGGWSGSIDHYEADVFDGSTTWTPTTSTPTNRCRNARLLVSGSVFALCNKSYLLFDPLTAKWTNTSAPSLPVGGESVSVLSTGTVFVIGGSGGSPNVLQFDPTTKSWSGAGNLVVPRYGNTSTTLLDDRILVTGGTAASTGDLLSSVEIDDRGRSCSSSGDCAAGYCVDGVCCDAACDGACEVCNAPGSLGTCIPTANGSPPQGSRPACGDGSCAGTCGGIDRTKCTNVPDASVTCAPAACADTTHAAPARTCDGAGTCKLVTPVDCGKYVCDGATGSCRTSCATTADCASGFGCDAGACRKRIAGASCSSGVDCESGFCVDGTCCTTSACEPPLRCDAGAKRGTCARPEGAACSTADQCGTGFCVDGVCCESACSGQCERCDASGALGKCIATAGPPRSPRAACAGVGVCAGRCDGTVRDACTFPGAATSCAPSMCDRGTETLAAGCDGAGACAKPTTRACSPFKCGASGCKTTCTTDDDCEDGTRCDAASGRCIIGAKCDGDHTVTSPDGTSKDCTPLRCAGTTCLPDCETSSDCVSGFVCDLSTKTCSTPPVENDSGCAFGGRRGSAFATSLLLLWVLGRRRR